MLSEDRPIAKDIDGDFVGQFVHRTEWSLIVFLPTFIDTPCLAGIRGCHAALPPCLSMLPATCLRWERPAPSGVVSLGRWACLCVLQDRCEMIRQAMEATTSDYDREKLQVRTLG